MNLNCYTCKFMFDQFISDEGIAVVPCGRCDGEQYYLPHPSLKIVYDEQDPPTASPGNPDPTVD